MLKLETPIKGAHRVDHLLIAEMVEPGMRVLDVGCGTLGLRALAPGLDLTGVDRVERPSYPGPFVRADATASCR